MVNLKKALLTALLGINLFMLGAGVASARPYANFRGFLNTHPAIAGSLYRHPAYLHNWGWVHAHPDLAVYLGSYPGIVALPPIYAPYPVWYPYPYPYPAYCGGYNAYTPNFGVSIGFGYGGGYYGSGPYYRGYYGAPGYGYYPGWNNYYPRGNYPGWNHYQGGFGGPRSTTLVRGGSPRGLTPSFAGSSRGFSNNRGSFNGGARGFSGGSRGFSGGSRGFSGGSRGFSGGSRGFSGGSRGFSGGSRGFSGGGRGGRR